MTAKKGSQKLVDDCLKILKEQSAQATQRWINDSKITSLALRNVKALQIISLSNYILQKMLIAQNQKQHQLLVMLIDYHKRSNPKCYEYARLVKHFSQWDYEFQYVYRVAMDEQLPQLGLYLRVRQTVLHSLYNKGKKELLSGVTAQLQQWATLARTIFREKEEEDTIDQFTTVVKQHYMQIKKSQSDKINGAQFLKICQIIDNVEGNIHLQQSKVQQQQSKTNLQAQKKGNPVTNILQETVLNGLSTQDRELIRVLSYQDKNIAKLLQQKHTKMISLIGQEVNNLRKDINHQKQRYNEVAQEKNALIRLIQRLKECALKYILNRNESSEFQLLQLLDNYNKKYNARALDVAKTMDIINNRRLIEIIEKQELQADNP